MIGDGVDAIIMNYHFCCSTFNHSRHWWRVLDPKLHKRMLLSLSLPNHTLSLLFPYSSPIIAAAKSFTASSTPRQFPLHRLRFVFLRFLSSGSSLIVRLLDMPPRSAPPSSPPPAAKRRKLSSPSVSLCLVLPLFYVSYPFLFISVLGPRRLFCASVATKY